MKILIIPDRAWAIPVGRIKKACKKYNTTVIVFAPPPKKNNLKDTVLKLKALCEREKFDFALLDYKHTTQEGFSGNKLVPILKSTSTPFIGFSDNFTHNKILEKEGAGFSVLNNSFDFDAESLISKLLVQIS